MFPVLERGASARLTKFLALPCLVTLALDGERFTAVVELFGVRLKTLLDVPVHAIRTIRVSRRQGVAEFDVVLAHLGTVALTVEPLDPSRWVGAFAEAGIAVDDQTKGRLTANRAVYIYARIISVVGVFFAALVLLLVILMAIAGIMKR